MLSDYGAIRTDHGRLAKIAENSVRLLAGLYADRTHFLFELLQNAEDALKRRQGWQGPKSVSCHLKAAEFSISHFGKPFDRDDVLGICSIGDSTKDLTDIGRFGIGFKSVYAFTDRPEIHSGDEHFAIERYISPVRARAPERHVDETLILLPLRDSNQADHGAIAVGLQRLGARALLFLRQIEEISWRIEGGRSGSFLRESEVVDTRVRRVTVIGQERGETEVDESWLVFSRPVTADDGRDAGHVEIAFFLAQNQESRRGAIQHVERAPLVAFFPTAIETHLGFLVQGPYRTTPSRDNVPPHDPWNQHLVEETASLLVEALRWMRDHGSLDTTALRCLPLDRAKFGEDTLFPPLFAATKQALSSEPLLPRFDTGHATAARARLARQQDLRELFSPAQLAALFGQQDNLAWLSGDITQDREPELRQYLVQELGVGIVTPETIIPKLEKPFLEVQPDSWILDLYDFLRGQPALRRRLQDLPLIRLQDGSHVPPRANRQPQAFLPGRIATGFPTVRASVCATETAREFLQSLGLTEPDPVDDVVLNVLPKYCRDDVYVAVPEYTTDIGRILGAFFTDSKGQRDKLLAALREIAFVMAVDAENGTKRVAKPGEVYLATERLKELFAGVTNVLLVDDSYTCLRGEDARELLEACGATRYLQRIPVVSDRSTEQLKKIRRDAGLERRTREDRIKDATLRGLDMFLNLLPQLEPEVRERKAALLWEALADVVDRRGSGAFEIEYKWGYSHESKTATLDAGFVVQLNEIAWVPDAKGLLQCPELILFDTLGWKPNPFLQSKICFKLPVVEQLAREAKIEPGVLDLLKEIGVTSVADLKDRLGLEDELTAAGDGSPNDVEAAIEKLVGDTLPPTPPVPDANSEHLGPGGRGNGSGPGTRAGASGDRGAGASSGGRGEGRSEGTEASAGKREAGSAGGRPFISYVGAHPDEEETDPEGLDQSARMELEAQAIELILTHEPQWQRTKTHQPGFDLIQAGEDGKPTRWCEVKAMNGSLHDRPVGLSCTQFEHAQEHGEAYWLYVVEHAGTDSARIVRIQDPAGKARTFTFDHGWLDIADMDSKQKDREG